MFVNSDTFSVYMDTEYQLVHEFAKMRDIDQLWHITGVRVMQVWEDDQHNRVLVWMLDFKVCLIAKK